MSMNKNELNKVKNALIQFRLATLELANVLDEAGYELSSAPEALSDMEDFSYDTITFVEDEINIIKDIEKEMVKRKINA